MPDDGFRFAFYERVRVIGPAPSLDAIRGEAGTVLGRAEGAPEPGYAVWIEADGACWDLSESALAPTGQHDRREDIYDDAPRLRVSTDGDLLRNPSADG